MSILLFILSLFLVTLFVGAIAGLGHLIQSGLTLGVLALGSIIHNKLKLGDWVGLANGDN